MLHRGSIGFMALFLLLVVISGRSDGSESSRNRIDLAGGWEYLVQAGATADFPDRLRLFERKPLWQKVDVPHWQAVDRAWYRRALHIPKAMKGARVELYFHGVGFHSKLYVNKQPVGENYFVVCPWAVDITDFLQFGRDNVIHLMVESANVSASATGKAPWTWPQAWWTSGTGAGIYYNVELRTHPAVYVSDMFVQPSFRHKRLAISVTLSNQGREPAEVSLANHVLGDKEQVALAFESKPVRLGPGESKTVNVDAAWKDPHYWFPHDPYLYSLQTQLTVGEETVDDLRTWFGFREYWIEKTYFMFNGVRAPIRRTTEAICYIPRTREAVHNYIWQIRQWGINNLRWHALPVPEYLLEEADEQGILITQEGDMWMDQGNYVLSDEFWGRFAESWVQVARYSRNHPCVFSYSVANESFNCDKGVWTDPKSPTYLGFHRANEAIKRIDPRTIIEYASGDDMCGDVRVRNWHYPSNLATRWNVPNDLYWLGSNPCPGSPEVPGKRNKPVIVGEDFYDGFRGPIGAYAAYAGEDYYLAGPEYKKGKVYNEITRLKTNAYRMSGMAAVNPADPCVKPWAAGVIPPVALMRRDFRQDFPGESRVSVGMGLANEVWFAQPLEVKWKLVSSADGKAVREGTNRYPMDAGTIKNIAVTFLAPKVNRRMDYTLKVDVFAGGKMADHLEHRISLFPNSRLTTPDKVKIGVFDPAKTSARILRDGGLQYIMLPDLSPKTLKGLNALILGPKGLSGKSVKTEDLTRFVEQGGRMLLLGLGDSDLGLCGEPLQFDPAPSTIVFPCRPDHLVFKGLQRTDLRWWDRDNWVTSGSILKPRLAYARPLVESGDPLGLRRTSLMEVQIGRGRVLYCQMPLLEKIKLPVAKLLLQNLVNYLAVKSAEPIKAGLVAPESSPVATAVVRMKMAAIRVNDPKADLRPFGLLVVDPESLRTSTEMTEAVKQYAANGGTVLLKSITPDHAQIVQSLTGMLPTVTALQPHQGFRCETGGLVSGIGQFDLWWRVGDWVEHQDVTKSVAPICHHVLGNLGTAKVLVVGLPGWSMVTPELEKQLKTNSVALAELTVGKGKVILDQVLWEQPAAAIIGFQYAAQLLANLGATVELPLKIQR